MNAKAKDKNYRKIGETLGLLGFYFVTKDQYIEAKGFIEEAIQIFPNSPYTIDILI